MGDRLHYNDARWRDMPRLLTLLVWEIQGLRKELKQREDQREQRARRAALAVRT